MAISVPAMTYLERRQRLDQVLAALALVCLAPLFLVLAVAIKLDSAGPILYRQTRVGRNRRRRERREPGGPGASRRQHDLGGRLFALYKFRSMRADAEVRTGAVWAAPDDPRVTRVGRLLRRWHLDELPQLWNVLRGEMALIGPRPERPEFVGWLRSRVTGYALRLEVRPGLTGLAQVRQSYDRHLEDVRRKLAWDLLYLETCNPLVDARILLATVLGGPVEEPSPVTAPALSRPAAAVYRVAMPPRASRTSWRRRYQES